MNKTELISVNVVANHVTGNFDLTIKHFPKDKTEPETIESKHLFIDGVIYALKQFKRTYVL
jgi:hypothetical protein